MELTGSYRSFIAPMLLAVVIGTLVARTTEPRSIYDARLMDEQVAARRSYENRHHTESTRNFIRPIVRHAAPSALRKQKESTKAKSSAGATLPQFNFGASATDACALLAHERHAGRLIILCESRLFKMISSACWKFRFKAGTKQACVDLLQRAN